MVKQVVAKRLQFSGPGWRALIRPMLLRQWDKFPREVWLQGGTGTGKTILALVLLRLALQYMPGVSHLLMQRYHVDMPDAVLRTWEEEVLDPSDDFDRALLRGPKRSYRREYSVPGYGRLAVRGLDTWDRVKGTAFGIVWLNEATSFTEEHVQGIHTRFRGTVDVSVPFHMLGGDCNPVEPSHYVNRRCERGIAVRLVQMIYDNPAMYDRRAGDFTPEGREYVERQLTQTEGHMQARNLRGEWCYPSGAILTCYSEARHTYDGHLERDRKTGKVFLHIHDQHPVLEDKIEIVEFVCGYDWGRKHAGTLQVFGVDQRKRMFRVAEWYHSRQKLDWWANVAVEVWRRFKPTSIVCDDAAQDTIDLFNLVLADKTGGKEIAIPCAKRRGRKQKSNMEVVIAAFEEPAVFFQRGARQHAPDPLLATSGCQELLDEIPKWVYATTEGKSLLYRPKDEPDPHCPDDGLDAFCYARVEVLGGPKYRSEETRELTKGEMVDKILGRKSFQEVFGDAPAA